LGSEALNDTFEDITNGDSLLQELSARRSQVVGTVRQGLNRAGELLGP